MVNVPEKMLTGIMTLAMALLALAPFLVDGAALAQDAASQRETVMRLYGEAMRRYPGLTDMTAEEAMKLAGQGDILFIDVRTPHEQDVSMIPGAMPVKEFLERAGELQDRTLVAYCTIGSRSGNFAAQLARYGVEVINLEGSLLGWIHAGGGLEGPDGTPTNRVQASGGYETLVPPDYEAVP